MTTEGPRLHPDADGHRRMVETLRPAIERALAGRDP
jgi:hypothetical protein